MLFAGVSVEEWDFFLLLFVQVTNLALYLFLLLCSFLFHY
jgi:hypothetical protein